MHSVTVIIPAFNEAERIADVLATARNAPLVQEVVVVDDGSEDNTAGIAAGMGVKTIRLPINCGKGTAMYTGATVARGDVLLFLDADLRGLTPQQVDDLIRPVLDHQAGMSIGIFRGGRTVTDLAQSITPNISGQRCLFRDFFLATPLVEGSRSGVEVLLTAHARACKVSITVVPLAGATHTMKEEKLGLLPGAFARWRMYAEILTTLARYYLATRLPSQAPVGNE